MKQIDLPPVWLLAFLAVAWFVRWPSGWDGAFWPGLVLIALAVGLTIAAFVEFRRARTSIVPRQKPDALITVGIFGYSRNPIYLADLLFLTGFALIWGSLVGLALVPVLGLVLQRRFVNGEEAKLHDAFGAEYADYIERVRRWL